MNNVSVILNITEMLRIADEKIFPSAVFRYKRAICFFCGNVILVLWNIEIVERGGSNMAGVISALFESKFLRVFDLQYAPGKHYYDATRRTEQELVAAKSDEEFRQMIPDAVSCFVILCEQGQEPRLLLTREYRYPVGRFILSVPAGLIDPADKNEQIPALSAAAREIQEETGLVVSQNELKLVNPLVFSTPGMTDESNALACAVLHADKPVLLSQAGAVGSEKFDGFVPVTVSKARELLTGGKDEQGNFYSAYTWMALLYFVSGMWK